MVQVPRSVSVRGELQASDDLIIEGRVEGPVWCEGHAVTVAPAAVLHGDVVARDITVFGTSSGALVATEVVDLRSEAVVTGRVVAPRLIVNDGASFNGSSEPQHLEAALRVARHRRQIQSAPPAPAAAAAAG